MNSAFAQWQQARQEMEEGGFTNHHETLQHYIYIEGYTC